MPDRLSTLLATAERFRSSPRFGEAVGQYNHGLARLREAPRLVNRLIETDIRWRVVGYLLYLDADRERFGPEGGATYGRLLDICARRREASPRVLKTMLALLRLTGLVRAEKGTDGRSAFYRPTARMDSFVRDWLGYGIAALEALEPERGWARMFAEDQNLTRRFLVSGGRDHLAERPLAELMPEPLADLRLQAGAFSVILAVLIAASDERVAPSRSEIARRFGMSKTQVSNVIAAAAARKLFVLDDAGRPTPSPLLRDAYSHWVSIEVAYYAEHMRADARSAGA